MDDKEFKRFEKYEQFQKKDKEADHKAKVIRHPIKLSHFKAHEYKQLALQKQNRNEIEYGPEMTPQQGWQFIDQHVSNWSPWYKLLITGVIILILFIMGSSFVAI